VFGTIAPGFGAHAEYVCLPEQAAVAPKPADLSYPEAAALADATALCFLRDKANLRRGQTILVNGASGAVGTAAVQLARHFGASVTAVCSGANADLVRKLGAPGRHRLHPGRLHPRRTGLRCDLRRGRQGLVLPLPSRAQPHGTYLTTAPSAAIFLQMPWTARFGTRKAVIAFTGLREASEKRRELLYLRDLAEASALAPVVGACYPLPRIADAYRHVDAGHKRGNVVVTMNVRPH
jgi:NADPH:quinone reductase-like Zn-dependent oxidoreductase